MTSATFRIRAATSADAPHLLRLWELVFHRDNAAERGDWTRNAQEWFARHVEDAGVARLPIVDVEGAIVSTAVGTLELGVPNPHSPRGRAVRLANVITLPEHRGHGFGTAVVRDEIGWARSIEADRRDLSATADGQRIYEDLGFVRTRPPRMKLVL